MIEKKRIAEILFILFLIANLTYQNVIDKDLKWIGQLVDFSSLKVATSDFESFTRGKNILVLGDQVSLYNKASIATPYLNWQLSKTHFQNLDYYDVLTEVFKNFESSPPDVIIDLENIMPELMQKMPTISSGYTKTGNMVYTLKTHPN